MLDRLTEDDVRTLTGYVQTAAQVRWLQRKGFRHELDGRGRVLTAAPGRNSAPPRARSQGAPADRCRASGVGQDVEAAAASGAEGGKVSDDEPKPVQPIDAYRFARVVQPGCEHFLGRCRCGTPFWLRHFSPTELARIERNRLPGEGLDEEEVA